MATKQIIQPSKENIRLLREESHSFHQVYEAVMEEYGKSEMKLTDDTLNFGKTMIQTVGLIAGFGFTAISAVKNIRFFIIGEVLLLSAIGYGIYKIKRFYTLNLTSVQSSFDVKSKAFKAKSDYYGKYISQLASGKPINPLEMQRNFNIVTAKTLETFNEVETKKDEGYFLNIIIILLISGGLVLLLSLS